MVEPQACLIDVRSTPESGHLQASLDDAGFNRANMLLGTRAKPGVTAACISVSGLLVDSSYAHVKTVF